MTSGSIRLTSRDLEIVEALALKVRLFNQRQVAENWWVGDLANTRRGLRRLESVGLLARATVSARSLPELKSPLASWSPGETPFDFAAMGYRCQLRWKNRRVHPCTVWIATQRAAQAYGGVRRGEVTQPLQATHDLGVAAVWLRLREVAPAWAEAWHGEDLMASTRRGEKLPDAFVLDEDGNTKWVIEFAGSYDAERVQAFHNDCASRNISYQLW